MTVVSPVPWFPLQGLIRRFRPHYRPMPPRRELWQGLEVWHPRFFAVPGLGRRWDGLFMALASLPLLRRLKCSERVDIIDAHFAYPDGYAASLLGRWLDLPVTITLRGTEVRHARIPALRRRMVAALAVAARVFSVSDSLRREAVAFGIPADKITVVGNGVDAATFRPEARAAARARLDLEPNAPVLVSVGGLTERKGFHRVIACFPRLLERYPNLVYLIVGGASPEGDWGARLADQVRSLGLARHVRFVGPVPQQELRWPLSAADVFVLATRNEGWANVFLEAMACGLPVITTDVGGNREVVVHAGLGRIVPFGNEVALTEAIAEALGQPWDRAAIRRHAEANAWDTRVAALVGAFKEIAP